MKIIEIISQHRRDFTAEMKCEFCENVEKLKDGYDDRYFHDNVIPKMKCSKCQKSTESEGGTPDKVQTRYPEGYQI